MLDVLLKVSCWFFSENLLVSYDVILGVLALINIFSVSLQSSWSSRCAIAGVANPWLARHIRLFARFHAALT